MPHGGILLLVQKNTKSKEEWEVWKNRECRKL